MSGVSAETLPNLIVIGAQKCGTTAVHNYLDLHPEISMSSPKELDFFIDEVDHSAGDGSDAFRSALRLHPGNWNRGLDWYAGQFNSSAAVRGESSPSYTAPWRPGAATRIASVIPGAKLILMVRDPIERMLSHWLYFTGRGIERRSLEEAFAEPRNLYLALSRYHRMLRPYLERFPLDRILVIAQENLLRRRRQTMRDIYRFAEVDESFWSPKIEQLQNRTAGVGIYRFRRRLERLPGAAIAYRTLPGEVKWRIESLLDRRSSRSRGGEPLEADARRRLAEELSEDTTRLRVLTGHAFDAWSI